MGILDTVDNINPQMAAAGAFVLSYEEVLAAVEGTQCDGVPAGFESVLVYDADSGMMKRSFMAFFANKEERAALAARGKKRPRSGGKSGCSGVDDADAGAGDAHDNTDTEDGEADSSSKRAKEWLGGEPNPPLQSVVADL